MSYIPQGSTPITCDPHIIITANAMSFITLLLMGVAFGFWAREIINWVKDIWERWKK